jgi:ketosteroid isomerase-like protein
MSRDEFRDRLEIKTLVDAYAHNADRKDPVAYIALYAEDAQVTIFAGDPDKQQQVSQLNGRAEIEKGFREHLMPYEITTHMVGQNTLTLDGDQGTGEVYILAHNIWTENGVRTLMVMGVRYEDQYVHRDGRWLFRSRTLRIDWTNTRPL